VVVIAEWLPPPHAITATTTEATVLLLLLLLLLLLCLRAAAAAAAAAEAFLLHCRVNSGVMRSDFCPVYRVCSVMLAATRREAQCSAVAEAQAASSTAASAAAVHTIEEPFAFALSPPRPKELYLTEPSSGLRHHAQLPIPPEHSLKQQHHLAQKCQTSFT
jgi:hypothetical protein